ncbi:MAG: hydrogenase maturation protease [Gammaproteobacteria bacterium]|nr:MAG: hydrogenase maturation protease [Gammaproteobacteria bacterium]
MNAHEEEQVRTLVLAVGNLLMTDEGAAIHVLDYLQQQEQSYDDVIYMDGGTLSFSIAGHIENAEELIIIDAAELKAEPGTVATFIGDDMEKQLGNCKLSVHEVGLVDLMDMAKLSGHLPEKRALVGIQPLTIADWSDQPSEPVRAAIPIAAKAVNEIIDGWRA